MSTPLATTRVRTSGVYWKNPVKSKHKVSYSGYGVECGVDIGVLEYGICDSTAYVNDIGAGPSIFIICAVGILQHA